MKKLAYVFLMGAALFNPASASAEGSAVTINLGGSGGDVDRGFLHEVRKTIGYAFSGDTIDTVYMYSPRVGGPVPREGGFSACVEAGFGSTPNKFNAFLQQLRSINSPPGNFYNIELTASCKPIGSTSH